MKPKKQIMFTFLFLVIFFHLGYGQISGEEYALRRSNVISALKPNTLVAMRSADYQTRGGDVTFPYRQESSFFYLTGSQKSNSYLLLTTSGYIIRGKKIHSILFYSEITNDSLIEISGTFHAVLNTKKFKDIFNELLTAAKVLYFSAPGLSFVNDWLNNRPLFIENESRKLLKKNYPELEIINSANLIIPFRKIKSKAEIEIIKKAADITSDGLLDAIKKCRPGMKEYELKAAVEYQMIRQGAMSTSFPSIIASGPNALILHYDECIREMQDGDLVVMDVGAEYNGYTADITRTIPVNGKFSAAQKELYDLVLKARNEAVKMVRPGISLHDVHNKVLSVLAEKKLEQYMPYFVSHHFGIDVHEMGESDTLKAGMVFTIEPGVYIPANEESVDLKYRGIGIRIEDDILVTDSGYIVISDKVPVDAKLIEELMD